jgi:hypothetical protein
VDSLVQKVRDRQPEFFEGPFIADWPPDPQDKEGERKARQLGAWLVAEAALVGKCAWWTDELIIKAGSVGESYRVLNWNAGRIWDAANAYHGDSQILSSGSEPDSPPPATVPPGSVPPSSPTPGAACPLAAGTPGYVVEVLIGPHGTSGQQWDATAYLRSAGQPVPPSGWTGVCGSVRCALNAEKDQQNGTACTLEHCGPEIVYGLSPSEAGGINWVQGYTVKLTMSSAAMLRGCCSKFPNVCGEVAVP